MIGSDGVAPLEGWVEALGEDGRGIIVSDGNSYLIDDVIPGERVEFQPTGKKRGNREGVVVRLIESSPKRVVPRCVHFAECGGCSLQHIEPGHQISLKQDRLVEQLCAVNVTACSVEPPISGPPWEYRHKARLGAKWVSKKDMSLVGFRERRNNHIAVLSRCEVLHPTVGARLVALRKLIGTLDARELIPQVEMATGRDSSALVFRHTGALGEADRRRLIAFSNSNDLTIYLQPGGPETLSALWPSTPLPLVYELPKFNLVFEFGPLEFVQVNPDTNARLVERVVNWLAPTATDRVLDLFCGLGNFTLPLARRGASVVGLEGSDELVARARDNAKLNDVAAAEFYAVDLSDETACRFWLSQQWDKLLLDPPRSGAASIINALSPSAHRHIVYVSCNPVSLTRDADVFGESVRVPISSLERRRYVSAHQPC